MVQPSGSVVTRRSFRLYLVWYTGHGLGVVLAVEGASVVVVVVVVLFVVVVTDSVVVVGAFVLGASVVSRLFVVIDSVISTVPLILELVDETRFAVCARSTDVVTELFVSATIFDVA